MLETPPTVVAHGGAQSGFKHVCEPFAIVSNHLERFTSQYPPLQPLPHQQKPELRPNQRVKHIPASRITL